MPQSQPKSPRSPRDDARLFDPNVVKPSAVTSLGVTARQNKASAGTMSAMPRKARPPFRPCNPVEARDTITEVRHGYVGLHSPYDLAHKLQMLERAEAQKMVISGKYDPNSWSKARKAIQVNYYLNSPDAETIEAERRYIQEKAQRNMVEYYRRLRN